MTLTNNKFQHSMALTNDSYVQCYPLSDDKFQHSIAWTLGSFNILYGIIKYVRDETFQHRMASQSY